MAGYHFLSGFTAQGGGHGGRRRRAEPDVLDLLRRAVHAARPGRVRDDAARSACAASGPSCWLVNTGWSGGPYGVGKRMSIAVTRSLLKAALDGRAGRRGDDAAPRLPGARAARTARTCRRSCWTRARRGRTRPPTTRAPRRWRASSSPTSSGSPAACRKSSRRPARSPARLCRPARGWALRPSVPGARARQIRRYGSCKGKWRERRGSNPRPPA